MEDRIIKVYYSPEQPPLDQYYVAYAVDEHDNLVWVSKYSTDDPVLLDECDDWYWECVRDIPDIPVLLNKDEHSYIDYSNKDYIGEITLRYTDG